MKVSVPRYLIVATAALFSGYHLVLAAHSLVLGYARAEGPVLLAMVLYAAATTLALLPTGRTLMPTWMAVFIVAVAVAVPLLVTDQLDSALATGNGHATWYIAAIGTLMTITSTRRRHAFAWVGVLFLIGQTTYWASIEDLVTLGVIGSVVWVAIAHSLSYALARAARDSGRFAAAEREAAEWQAAQEAHLHERQARLGQTSSRASRMLRIIRDSGGELTEEQRQECLHLEGAIRDEIRGRRLLSDDVREQVMRARRRGVTVTLLDEGGIDDLTEDELDRVHSRLAEAIGSAEADRIVVRTVQQGQSPIAVTVVGIREAGDAEAAALGIEPAEEDEVTLWLEIPRAVAATADAATADAAAPDAATAGTRAGSRSARE